MQSLFVSFLLRQPAAKEFKDGADGSRQTCRDSHLGQAPDIQVEADDEDVPGYPQSCPYCILEGGGDEHRLMNGKDVI